MKWCNIITTFKSKNVLLYVEFFILLFSFTLMVNHSAIARDSYRRITIKIQKRSPLGEQLASPNCIYEVYDEFDLCDSTFILPDNVVLRFKGGRFSNGTIIGKNSTIDASSVYILNDVSLQGTWQNEHYYPEWFGAVGDGKTDDTECIRQTMIAAKGKTLQFQRKTYIINVKAGSNNEDQRTIFSGCKCVEMIGNKTVIRLGDNDNCNLYKFKGFGAMFSVYTIDSFHVKGITFDFNYEKNPIYQTQGVRQGIQENTQLNAFQFRRVRKVIIEDCKFIGHSGTNCIDYNDAKYDEGDKTFEVTIENCEFIKCGDKSFFKINNTLMDAYHDCSTIAIHYCGNNHETQYIVNVRNNYFEGVGGNAYNVIETDAKEFNFYGNTVTKYASGVYPCANIYEAKISIQNNNFLNVSRAILLWLKGGTDVDSNQYGFSELNVKNNKCSININYWKQQQRYDNIESIVGNRYGFIFTAGGNNKSVKKLSINCNSIRYVDVKGLSSDFCLKAVINFESASTTVKMMRCDKLTVSNNQIFNAVNRILHNSMFQEIDTLIFDDNYIFKPFSVNKATSIDSGGIIFLNHSKAYTPSLDNPIVKNLFIRNNSVIYNGYKPDDGCAVILNCKMLPVDSFLKNKIIVKGNSCKSMPQYGMVRFTSMQSIFGSIDVE